MKPLIFIAPSGQASPFNATWVNESYGWQVGSRSEVLDFQVNEVEFIKELSDYFVRVIGELSRIELPEFPNLNGNYHAYISLRVKDGSKGVLVADGGVGVSIVYMPKSNEEPCICFFCTDHIPRWIGSEQYVGRAIDYDSSDAARETVESFRLACVTRLNAIRSEAHGAISEQKHILRKLETIQY